MALNAKMMDKAFFTADSASNKNGLQTSLFSPIFYKRKRI